METMVNVYLFGKLYRVPDNLTIMRAMEYAGYQLVRGCGCRNGFCGAWRRCPFSRWSSRSMTSRSSVPPNRS